MTAYECPYFTGAEFVLILTDPARIESTCHVRVKVLQTYPFTKSQAMQVAILNVSHEYKGHLPSIAFLKLFDRRFLDDRAPLGANPWDHEKEAKAKEIHQIIQPCLVEPNILVKCVGLPSMGEVNRGKIIIDETMDFDEDDYQKELELCPDIHARNQWITEMEYRYQTTSWFKTECRAYRQLNQLQGSYIPNFYGTTLFDQTSELPLGIDTDVPGILLEFIDGVTLEDIEIQSTLSTEYPHIAEAALECFDKITLFGVIHNDIRLANIMVNNIGRICLIDFAFALFRATGVSDEDWDKCVDEQGEVPQVKFLLDKKGLRDRTPPMPYLNKFGSYLSYDISIATARESWRLKYYEPANFVHSSVLDGVDEHGNPLDIYLPDWVPKYKAMAERKIYLNQMRIRYKELFDSDDLSSEQS